MTRARILLATAVALMLVHGLFRVLGFGEHASVIAGMPLSDASWILGPLYAVSWLVFVTFAPILSITAVLDLIIQHRP